MKMKRMLAMLLAGLITLSCCPVSVLAAESDPAPEAPAAEQTELEAAADTPAESEAAEVLSETGSAGLEEIPETEQTTEPVYAVVAEGTCGEGLTWVLDDSGTLTISGTGAMTDYRYDDAPWYSYRSSITSLVLEEGITHIGNYALYSCTGLTGSLVLPEGLTPIGDGVFQDCDALTGIVLPESLTSIGESAFQYCTGLTSVTIPAKVTVIGNQAFYGCTGLIGELIIPDSVTTIGAAAFYDCSCLTGLTLGRGLTHMGMAAFQRCSSVTGSLILPDSLTAVPELAFGEMENVTSVVFGNGIRSVGMNAFELMTAVKEVTFTGETVPVFDDIFTYMSVLKTVYVPYAAYSDYVNACRDSLPDGARIVPMDAEDDFIIEGDVLVAYIGTAASVTIPDGIRHIGPSAFRGCSNVQHITIPDSVVSIDEYAFYGCSGLLAIDLPDGLTSIGQYAFYNCSSMAGQLVIPDGVTEISFAAFYSCKSLNGVVFGASLQKIDQAAFTHCSSLRGNLVLPDGVTEIGNAAFRECKKLTGLTLPEGLRLIRSSAFRACSGLRGTLVLPSTLTHIGDSAFEGCSGLTGELIIPDDVGAVRPNTFKGMEDITSIVVGKGITAIDTFGTSNAFGDMEAVREVTFRGSSVPTVNKSYSPFRDMTALTTVYVPREAYDAYAEAYSQYLPEGVELVAMSDLEAAFTDAGVILSGDGLEDYLEVNALLMMAAYDADGRCLSVTDTVSQVVGGTCRMVIEAEDIAEVRLYVMDWDYHPLTEAFVFEK